MKYARLPLFLLLLAALILPPILSDAGTSFQNIYLRRGTAAAWTAADNVLGQGEPGFETDTGKLKIGDGLTTWTSLTYLGSTVYQALDNGVFSTLVRAPQVGSPSFTDNGYFRFIFGGGSGPRISGFTFGAAGNTDNGVFNNLNLLSLTITDNTIDGVDFKDNTIDPAKFKAISGTPGVGTFYRGDGRWTSIPYLASYRNLKITTTGALDNQSVLITADKVVVTDNTDGAVVLSTVSLTDNLATAGANGLDNGSLAANVGYFLYVIYNGTLTRGLASTSATAPILPAGYTYKALVGWCTTDNTTTPFNVEEFTQVDDQYTWAVPQRVITTNNGAGGDNTFAVNLAAGGVLTYAVVPPNITTGIRGKCYPTGTAPTIYMNPVTFANSPGGGNEVTCVELLVSGAQPVPYLPIIESQTFYFQSASNTLDKLWVTGFTLRR